MSKSIKFKNNVFLDSSSISNNTNPLNKQIPKHVSQSYYAADLNDEMAYGQYEYNNNTLNSPYKQDSSYDPFGIVFSVGNNFDPSWDWYWGFQIALGTSGGIYIRRKINQNNITNWKKII